ncbi:MAG: ABC transporter transmembrane domain-containing protein [Rickettsiales bacterium]|nr:ABC transporter transmembrane domain-containing protein [Rickettsiales bacterium]
MDFRADKKVKISELLLAVLSPEHKFYKLALVYGVAIGILTLAVPIAVQTLIGAVANTAIYTPVIVLAIVLFIVLLFYVLLNSLQIYILEVFERHFFSRIVSEIVLTNIYAKHSYFESINRDELINRYFDVMNVQEIMPKLLIDGFALALQTIVGILVVSFYHPALLMFNIVLVAFIYVTIKIWSMPSIRTAISLSKSKYNVAKWLEELARINSNFKSERAIIYALKKSDELVSKYNDYKKRHFKQVFTQSVVFYLLYAIFSAALLGIGGSLVVSNQLTLGQLVASELILSAIFYALSKAGGYLKHYYKLCAAVEEITHLFDVPLERETGHKILDTCRNNISFDKAEFTYRDQKILLNFSIPENCKILASSDSYVVEKTFIDSLNRYIEPNKGRVLINDNDIYDFEIHNYRNNISIVDNAFLLEGTIYQFMKFCSPQASRTEILETLKMFEVYNTVESLKEGINTKVTHTGFPLSHPEVIRLKLAGAFISKPKILVIGELFDMVANARRERIMERLSKVEGLTLIYFTNRINLRTFDKFMYLGWQETKFFDTIEELKKQ